MSSFFGLDRKFDCEELMVFRHVGECVFPTSDLLLDDVLSARRAGEAVGAVLCGVEYCECVFGVARFWRVSYPVEAGFVAVFVHY